MAEVYDPRTPWTLEVDTRCTAFYCHEVRDAKGHMVFGDPTGDTGYFAGPEATGFIVHAVNCHAMLVEALQASLDAMREVHARLIEAWMYIPDETIALAELALEQAGVAP